MSGQLQNGEQQFIDANGKPLDGGTVDFYIPNTTTRKNTWQDQSLTILNTNPVVLDAAGRAVIWGTGSYRQILKDKHGNLVWDKVVADALAPLYPITGASVIGADDGASGTLFTTVAGFIAKILSSAGASIVGFIQSGAGAIFRVVQDKLREQLPSPEDYGATGINDDTDAVQKCLSANSAIRLLSGKTYTVSKLSITRDVDIFAYGAKLLHKAGAGLSGGMIENLSDHKVRIFGLEADGNYANQSAAAGSYNFIWNSIGSMQLFNCYVHDSKGHLFRSGNIDNFDATKFAHDVVIESSSFVNPTSNSGDCCRVERTRGYSVRNSTSTGGFSGFRTQLYCRDVDFINVKSTYAYADCGITVAMSWRVRVFNCEGAFNFLQGCEIDAVVNYRSGGNSWHDNMRSGRFSTELGAANYIDSPTYAGSIAEGFGSDYSNQTHSSPKVPNLDAVFGPDISYNNSNPDRFIGQSNETMCVDTTFNNPSISGGYTAQLSIEGGTINKTGVRVIRPTFVAGSNDLYCIQYSNYQFDGYVTDAAIIGNKRLSQYAATGMFDLNSKNRYLTDPSKRSVLLTDVADPTSVTGSAISGTTTGSQTYPFTGIYGGGQGEKLLRIVARVNSGTQSATLSVNLYDSAGVFVATVLSGFNIIITTGYKEFIARIPNSASVGCELRPQLTIPIAGVTVYLQEINIYTSAA